MLMMLPFEAPTIFEGIHKSYFRMPRVVKDQRSKFENDDLFRQLSHESAVKYTGFKDRPLEERQMKFIASCQEGHTEISVVQSGNQFVLTFNPTINPAYNNEGCDFDKELGKVHIKSAFILNGVCVFWRGWIDLQRLEGFGCLEFDEFQAYCEEAALKQQIDKQQTCNNAAAAAAAAAAMHQTSPMGRYNHHPHHPHHHPLAALNSLPPVPPAAPPTCLAAPLPGHPIPPHPVASLVAPPVSLADSYGNAAIAAAAAAAFHQALSVGAQPPPNSLHGQLGAASSAAAAAAVAMANGLPSAHLAYGNGGVSSNGTNLSIPASAISSTISAQATRLSPPSQHLSNGQSNGLTRSPEREPTDNGKSAYRQATKRSHSEEQTQLEDVDVVSDISSHDIDYPPPKRMFKSESIAATGPHQHHHRATRRT